MVIGNFPEIGLNSFNIIPKNQVPRHNMVRSTPYFFAVAVKLGISPSSRDSNAASAASIGCILVKLR